MHVDIYLLKFPGDLEVGCKVVDMLSYESKSSVLSL